MVVLAPTPGQEERYRDSSLEMGCAQQLVGHPSLCCEPLILLESAHRPQEMRLRPLRAGRSDPHIEGAK